MHNAEKLIEIIETQRLRLCQAGLSPTRYDSLEKAVGGVLDLVEALRRDLADPDHATQETVLRKLANSTSGWALRLPEYADNRVSHHIEWWVSDRHLAEVDDRRLRELMPREGDRLVQDDQPFDIQHTGYGFRFELTDRDPGWILLTSATNVTGLSQTVGRLLLKGLYERYVDSVLFCEQGEVVHGEWVRE